MCRDVERWEVNEVQMPGKKIEPQWLFLDTLGIPLKAGILIHTNVLRVCGVFFISNLFIMTFAFIGLAQIIHLPRMDAANNEILDRVRFFLPL